MDGDYTNWLAAITATVMMLGLGRRKRMFEPKRTWVPCTSCGRHLVRGRRCSCLDD